MGCRKRLKGCSRMRTTAGEDTGQVWIWPEKNWLPHSHLPPAERPRADSTTRMNLSSLYKAEASMVALLAKVLRRWGPRTHSSQDRAWHPVTLTGEKQDENDTNGWRTMPTASTAQADAHSLSTSCVLWKGKLR